MLLRNWIVVHICFSLFVINSFGFLEVFVGIGSVIYQKLCFKGNCCTKSEIPANFNELEVALESKLYGQPLVKTTVVSALKSHWNTKYKPTKALTMSFHGGPGIGKNYVSKFIQESLYSAGMKSPHVHTFVARLDFPEVSQTNVYKRNLADWIRGNVTNCPRQLFIFDEVNSMPPGVLDVLKPFIDYIDYINGINYKETIFLFLSNTGTGLINEHVYHLWKKGYAREDLKLHHFEKLIAQGAFNEEGGFHRSDTIKSNLIDHYIPFLPLMQPHIKNCIIQEFKKREVPDPSENHIQAVLDSIDWGPDPHNIFAKTGCKRISQKVALLA